MGILRVYKSRRELKLWAGGALALQCPVALGFAPEGHKARKGDGRTPEGAYRICARNPQSKYHLSLALNYPNAGDARAGYAAGVIGAAARDRILAAHAAGARPPFDTELGGWIMLHGGGAARDWTAGCIALDDGDMDRLWALADCVDGVEIFP